MAYQDPYEDLVNMILASGQAPTFNNSDLSMTSPISGGFVQNTTPGAGQAYTQSLDDTLNYYLRDEQRRRWRESQDEILRAMNQGGSPQLITALKAGNIQPPEEPTRYSLNFNGQGGAGVPPELAGFADFLQQGAARGDLGPKELALGMKGMGEQALKVRELEEGRKSREEIAKNNQLIQQQRVDADQRYKEERIAMAKADKQREMAVDQAMISNSAAMLERLKLSAQELIDHPGLPSITGVMSKVPLAGGTLTFPGTDAANAKAKLETLKSQTGLNVLQELRANSKTGGALGQVSDFENKMLQANLAALDQAQTTTEYKNALQKIINYVNSANGRFDKAFQGKWGNQEQQGKTVVERRQTADGRILVRYSDGTKGVE